MNSFILQLLPIFFDQVVSQKSKSETLLALGKNISRENSDAHPYKGFIENNFIKFSKRDISLSIKSELTFKGKIIQANQQTIIKISGRYKIVPMLGYLIFMFLFTLIQWPIDHPFKIILPLIPYAIMVIKIKKRSKEILNDLKNIVSH